IDERLVMAAAEVNRQRIREGVVSGRIDQAQADRIWEESDPNLVSHKAVERYLIELGMEWQNGISLYADDYLTRLSDLDLRGIKNPALGITCDKALEYLQRGENIIESLKEKQKGEGLDVATSIEAIKIAVRREYHTAEEYLRMSKERTENNAVLEKLLNGIVINIFNREFMCIQLEYFVAEDVKEIWDQT
ncbi:hypothetical protein GOV03_01645, partial [Candidatus Woesearchaeota archaeon]|nr:hypothetical protein [Candidatus Woesearchaeota archaeon]